MHPSITQPHPITIYQNDKFFGTVVDEPPYTWDDLVWFLNDSAESIESIPYNADDTASEQAAKKKLPAWGPHRLVEGAKRNRMGVVAVTLLAADVDHATQAEVDGIAPRAAGRATIVYGSPRDFMNGERRVRIVGLPSREMTPAESDRARIAFAQALGFDAKKHGVDQALGAERLFFVGRMAGQPPREFGVLDGDVWDVDALLAGAPAPLTLVKPGGQEPAGDARAEKVRTILDALGDHHDHIGRRSNLCDAIGGLMRRDGATEAFCKQVIETWLAGACEEQNDPDAIKRGVVRACAAWKKAPHEVTGADAFAAILDTEEHAARVVDAIRKATGIAAMMKPTPTPTPAPVGQPIEAASSTPFLVQLRKSPPAYFVLDPRTPTPTYVECGKHSLHRTIDELAGSYIATKYKGRLIPISDILTEHAPTVGGVEWDFSAPGGLVYVRERDRMVGGVACPVIEPKFDHDVEAWLRALARDEARLAALKEWITSTRQDAIRRLATCLLVIGPHTIGKTLLAIVSARLWGASSPVPLNHVVKQFNASMTRTPVVLDDEAKTLARREITTEEFRTLIQNREREYEPKGQEMRMLRGAQRFVVTANDVSAFTFANGAGVGAVDAIAERLLQIVVPKEAGDHVRGLLDKLRRDDGEIDFDRMMGHFEHIRQTTPLPDASVRFLGSDPDKQAAQSAVVAGIVQEFELVFEMVASLLTDGASIGGINRDGETVVLPALFMAHGAVWARASHLAEFWALHHPRGPYLSVKDAQKALAPFRGPRDSVKFKGKSLRAWELDAGRLVRALGLDLAVVQRNLTRSSQK